MALEQKYAYDACPEGLLGINADQFAQYVDIADRRLEWLGVAKRYHRDNPFSLDVPGDGSVEEEELLRDPGDGVSDRGGARLGLRITDSESQGISSVFSLDDLP